MGNLWLPARGTCAVTVIVLFLACMGLSLLCPMTAGAPVGHGHATAQVGHHCPDSVTTPSFTWEPTAAAVLCEEATAWRLTGFRSAARVEAARLDSVGSPRYLLLTTFRL